MSPEPHPGEVIVSNRELLLAISKLLGWFYRAGSSCGVQLVSAETGVIIGHTDPDGSFQLYAVSEDGTAQEIYAGSDPERPPSLPH